MKVSAKLFLEDNQKLLFGPGRLKLLEAIRDLGSLRKAAKEMGMSYRWAWGRMNQLEKNLGISLMERTDKSVIGGHPLALTPEAHDLIAWFVDIERNVQLSLRKAEASAPNFIKKPSVTPAEGGDG